MPIRIIREANKLTVRIFEILELQTKELTIKLEGLQSRENLQKGLIEKDGILVPYESIRHRFLFDTFEAAYIDVIRDLLMELKSERRSSFTEFSFRTVIELCLKRAQIIYSKTLESKEKEKFKLIVFLADYAFIKSGKVDYIEYYEKLLNTHANLLSSNQQQLFEKLIRSIKDGTPEEVKLLKSARKLLESEQSRLFKESNIPDQIKALNFNNLELMLSTHSHLLHGDFLLVSNLIYSKKKKPTQHLFRTYWTLLFAGITIINYVSSEKDDIRLKIKNVNETFIVVFNELTTTWRESDSNG